MVSRKHCKVTQDGRIASQMNVWVLSLTKDIFGYDFFQQLRKKSHLQQCDIQIDNLLLLQEPFLTKIQKKFFLFQLFPLISLGQFWAVGYQSFFCEIPKYPYV